MPTSFRCLLAWLFLALVCAAKSTEYEWIYGEWDACQYNVRDCGEGVRNRVPTGCKLIATGETQADISLCEQHALEDLVTTEACNLACPVYKWQVHELFAMLFALFVWLSLLARPSHLFRLFLSLA